MNKQIEDLANQVGWERACALGYWGEREAQIFAERIILECMDVVKKKKPYNYDWESGTGQDFWKRGNIDAYNAIVKHFEVFQWDAKGETK